MGLRARLRFLLPSYRRAQELEMDEELRALSELAEPGELGNLTRAAEEARAAWGWTWLEQWYRDAQYAWRTMRRNPGFTVTVVLSVGLGIGANTAIFSLMDALMLRWLPVHDPQELVQVTLGGKNGAEPSEAFSNAIVEALAEQRSVFSGVCGYSAGTFEVGESGAVQRVGGAWVTGGYYETLGLAPALGRLLAPSDNQPGAPIVAVLSYGYWQRVFASDPAVVGRTIAVNRVPVSVVGVSPPGFSGPNVGAAADVTIPVSAVPRLEPAFAPLLQPGNFWLRVLARPRSGLPAEQAQSRLAALWPALAQRAVNPNWAAWQKKALAEARVALAPGGTGFTGLRARFAGPLLALLALTGLVLLLACANVASLLLARAMARRREISVRLAIGAGRGRILRQLLTESAGLALLGAALGVWLAWVLSWFLVKTLAGGGGVPLVLDLTPNWHVLGFAAAAAAVTALLFGLAPAVQVTAGASWTVLKDDTRVAGAQSRLLALLVAGQAGLAILLLVAAGLFGRTLQNLQNVDAGFRQEGVLVVDLDGEREGYQGDRMAEFYRQTLERARLVPGVVSASLTSHTPLSGSTWTEAVARQGEAVPQRDNAVFIAAAPGFFTTMWTPLLAGRAFAETDRGAPSVAIVNEAFAARFFAGANPIGQVLTATVTRPPSNLRIVGVVKDVLMADLRRAPRPIVYVSYFQRTPRTDALVVRVRGPLAAAEAALRKELQPAFPNGLLAVRPLTEQVAQTLTRERLMTRLSTGFGGLGLGLACVGLYGLLGYSVARRTREIGIRIALGARRRDVQWMVVRQGLVLLAAGAAVGVPAAWGVARAVQSMLFGVAPADPWVLAGAAGVLGVAGVAAALLPARRATRVDPVWALRHE